MPAFNVELPRNSARDQVDGIRAGRRGRFIEELAAAIDAICAGSGREVDATGEGCPVCEKTVGVNSGKLLTHSR